MMTRNQFLAHIDEELRREFGGAHGCWVAPVSLVLDRIRESGLTILAAAAVEPFRAEVSSSAPDFPPPDVLIGDHEPPISLTWRDLLALESSALDGDLLLESVKAGA